MKILVVDRKKGLVRLIPENTDDMWLLSTIIQKGDLVRAKTLREIHFGERGSGRSARVPMILTVKVEDVEFQPFTTRLRVRGIVVEGPEKYGVQGKYHTLSIEPGREVDIIKPSGWPQTLLSKLEEYSSYQASALIIAVDYDEYAIALVRGQGLKILASGSTGIPGKADPHRDEKLKEAVNVIAKYAVEIAAREKPLLIVVAGPGIVKELVAERIRELLGSQYNILVDDVSIGGEAGVYEEIRRGVMRRALREAAIITAERIVEEFERRLAKEPEKVAYTLPKVLKAVEAGAAAEILLLDNLLHSPDENVRKAVETLLKLADATGAKIHFVPSDSHVGFKLKAFGGIIALLRYALLL
jgi:protein pelota